MGPVVIGFFVFVIVGEGACIRLSRHGVPDSMPCMCFCFGSLEGPGGVLLSQICARMPCVYDLTCC